MKAFQLFSQFDPSLAEKILSFIHEDSKEVYQASLASLAQNQKLRPVFVQRKPKSAQIKWMGESFRIRRNDAIAEHLLQIWLLKGNKEMLVDFLSAMDIKHDKDGTAEDIPPKFDKAKLEAAVSVLLSKYPVEHVSIYLHLFQLQQSGGWQALEKEIKKNEQILFKNIAS